MPCTPDRIRLIGTLEDVPLADGLNVDGAFFERSDSRWIVRRANGFFINRVEAYAAPIRTFSELRIGEHRYLVESERVRAAHRFLSTVCAPASIREIDEMLIAITHARSSGFPINLIGDGDLVYLARRLHEHVSEITDRFVVVDKRRKRAESSGRAARAAPTLDAGFEQGDTICVRDKQMRRRRKQPGLAIFPSNKLIIVTGSRLGPTIGISSILGKSIAIDAHLRLRGLSEFPLSSVEESLLKRHATTHASLDLAITRWHAFRTQPTPAAAARVAGMKRPSFSQWLVENGLKVPTKSRRNNTRRAAM